MVQFKTDGIMKKIKDDEFLFECSGKSFSTDGCGEFINVDKYGLIRCGYDYMVDDSSNFTDEERKELAIYMIGIWINYGKLKE